MNSIHKISKIITFLVVILFLVTPSIAKDSPLAKLGHLVGSKWLVEAKWSNGQIFKQEVIYEWALNKTLLMVKTYGTINQETGEYGLRNEGVRAWDEKAGKVLFWEFDIFGGITSGECIIENGAFHFEYSYEIKGAVKKMRDSWIPVDENSYKYEVVMQENGEWSKALLSAKMKRQVE